MHLQLELPGRGGILARLRPLESRKGLRSLPSRRVQGSKFQSRARCGLRKAFPDGPDFHQVREGTCLYQSWGLLGDKALGTSVSKGILEGELHNRALAVQTECPPGRGYSGEMSLLGCMNPISCSKHHIGQWCFLHLPASLVLLHQGHWPTSQRLIESSE